MFTSENKCICFSVGLRKQGSEWCLCVSVATSHQLKMGEEHSVKQHEGQEGTYSIHTDLEEGDS